MVLSSESVASPSFKVLKGSSLASRFSRTLLSKTFSSLKSLGIGTRRIPAIWLTTAVRIAPFNELPGRIVIGPLRTNGKISS